MLGYVPKFIQTAKAYKAVIDSQGQEFDLIRNNLEDILKQFYVETATEWGIELWEQMLGFSSSADKPLNQRRSRVMARLRGIGTVNVNLIKNVVESYDCGTVEVLYGYLTYSFDVVNITELPSQTIIIRFIDSRGIPSNLEDLKEAIEEIKPAHLGIEYQFRYLTWNELDAQKITWDGLDEKNLTWDEFETGGWL